MIEDHHMMSATRGIGWKAKGTIAPGSTFLGVFSLEAELFWSQNTSSGFNCSPALEHLVSILSWPG